MTESLYILLALIVIPILSIAGAFILKFASQNKNKRSTIDNMFLLMDQFADLAFGAGRSESLLRSTILLVSLVCGFITVCFVIGAIARSF